MSMYGKLHHWQRGFGISRWSLSPGVLISKYSPGDFIVIPPLLLRHPSFTMGFCISRRSPSLVLRVLMLMDGRDVVHLWPSVEVYVIVSARIGDCPEE